MKYVVRFNLQVDIALFIITKSRIGKHINNCLMRLIATVIINSMEYIQLVRIVCCHVKSFTFLYSKNTKIEHSGRKQHNLTFSITFNAVI